MTEQHFKRLLAVLFAGFAWFVLPHTSLAIASQVNHVGSSTESSLKSTHGGCELQLSAEQAFSLGEARDLAGVDAIAVRVPDEASASLTTAVGVRESSRVWQSGAC